MLYAGGGNDPNVYGDFGLAIGQGLASRLAAGLLGGHGIQLNNNYQMHNCRTVTSRFEERESRCKTLT